MAESLNETVLTAVLYPALALLLAILAYYLKNHFSIPTLPSLLGIGIIIRAIAEYFGLVGTAATNMVDITYDAILLVFVPILIFECAFRMEWYTIKKELLQIIPLCTTVMLGCTILTALTLRYILIYENDWSDLLMLGLILNSTDNIVVDDLLKDIYASDNLEILIQGETLFNYATVFVIFQVFNAKDSASQSIANFTQLCFGGFGMGIITALAMSVIIKKLLNDFVQETNLIIVSIYLLFWVCEETTLSVSGPMALVVFGLYISANGKNLISPRIEEELRYALSLLSRNASSVLLIIAGLIFGNSGIFEKDLLYTKDYFSLFLIFPITYLIRAIVLLIHYPLLLKAGYGLTLKELAVVWISGLKGVISVALTLLMYQSSTVTDEHFKYVVVYFGIGTAALSAVFGGIGTVIATRYLGLESLNDVQENMLIGVTSALVELGEKEISALENNKDLQLVDWDYVLDLAGPTPLVISILNKSKVGQVVLLENAECDAKELLNRFASKFSLSKEALATEMRRRYLASLKSIYWEQVEEGLCHSNSSLILIDSCNRCLDMESRPMKDWQIVRKNSYNDSLIKAYSRLSKWPLIGHLFRRQLYKAIILAYDCANNFIKCHEETEKLIDEMEIDIDKNIFENVMSEAHVQVKICEEFMTTYIIDCYPEVLAEVQTKRCCKLLLYSQQELIEEVYEDGLIKEVEFLSLMEAIESSIQAVTFKGIPKMPLVRDILKYRFTACSPAEIELLLGKIIEKKFEPGEVLFHEGKPADGAFFILRGRVKETSSWIDQELIIGNIVGVQHLLEEFSHTYTSTAVAVTLTVVAHIPKDSLEIEGLIVDLYKEAQEEMILLNRERFDLLGVKERHILRVIEASSIRSFTKGKKQVFTDGALVLKGKVYEKQKNKWFVKPKSIQREIFEDCIVLMLPTDFLFAYDKELTLAECFKKFCVKVTNDIVLGKEMPMEEPSNSESKLDDTAILMRRDEDGSGFLKFKTVVPLNQVLKA